MPTEEYLNKCEQELAKLLKDLRDRVVASQGASDFIFKKDATVVTELDKEIEKQVKKVLKSIDNTKGFRGEEEGSEGEQSEYWLIDPIDGTESFVRGLPSFRCQVAFVKGGKPLFALAYRFASDEMYVAYEGKGLQKNGKSVTLTTRSLERSWFEMSINLLDPLQYKAFQQLRPKILGMMVTRDYLLVADGKIDSYISFGGGWEWDYVPRAFLLKEAGFKVTNIGSDTYSIGVFNMIACLPEHYDTVASAISVATEK